MTDPQSVHDSPSQMTEYTSTGTIFRFTSPFPGDHVRYTTQRFGVLYWFYWVCTNRHYLSLVRPQLAFITMLRPGQCIPLFNIYKEVYVSHSCHAGPIRRAVLVTW